jgi:hypothetical protein
LVLSLLILILLFIAHALIYLFFIVFYALNSLFTGSRAREPVNFPNGTFIQAQREYMEYSNPVTSLLKLTHPQQPIPFKNGKLSTCMSETY